MDDPFLMGVLHGMADLHEQLQPLVDGQVVLVAVLGDRDAADQLHDEVRAARVGRPGIKHPGDVRVVHQRQRLPLGLEPGNHLPRIHARLDDLERDAAADRRLLVGHVDDAHAPFADLLQQLVRTDERAGALGQRLLSGRQIDRGAELGGRLLQKAVGIVVGLEQGFDPHAKAASPPRPRSRNAARSAGGFSMAARKIDLTLFGSTIAIVSLSVACTHTCYATFVAGLSHEIEETV